MLLVGVVYWVYGLWGGHRRVECMQDLVELDGVWSCHQFSGIVKVIKGGENIITDGLCWVSAKFLVSGGIS